MMGCGVGDILEFENVDHFPSIKTPLTIKVIGDFGTNPERNPQTTFTYQGSKATLTVGDSKEGWALAYLRILTVSSTEFPQPMEIELDISNVRPAGEVIKGFGGVTNPSGLIGMFVDMVKVLNNAVGRQLTPLEVSLLGNLSARCTVAGNIRRSAKIGQFSSSDSEAASAKDNLWTQAEDGTWKVDPAKDPLRMSNFTRVWHTKPTLDEIKAAVRKQHQSGEGAIMYAPEALARANVDLLRTSARRQKFLDEYSKSKEQGTAYIQSLMETSNDN
jgi:ribonucleotide reductase class II